MDPGVSAAWNGVARFIGELVIYGGGAVAVAFATFRVFGERWLENKFANQLANHQHQQATELARLRIEIDGLLNAHIKLQEKEFEVLPKAWAMVHEGHIVMEWLTASFRQIPDLNRLDQEALEEFLDGSEFTETHKRQVRQAANKTSTYEEIMQIYRLSNSERMFRNFSNYVDAQALFIPESVLSDLRSLGEIYWEVIVDFRVGHEDQEMSLLNRARTKLDEREAPLYKKLENDIRNRLQAQRNHMANPC